MVAKWLQSIVEEVMNKYFRLYLHEMKCINESNGVIHQELVELNEIRKELIRLNQENEKLKTENEQLKRASQQTDVKNIVSEWLGGV